MNKISHDSETPAQDQQIITARAFIHRKIDGIERVCLPKRADTKKFLPGKYDIPGGHVDYGEEIKIGLKREIKEELGIEVALGDPFAVFTYTNEVKGSHSIEAVYFARLIDIPEAIERELRVMPVDREPYFLITRYSRSNLKLFFRYHWLM